MFGGLLQLPAGRDVADRVAAVRAFKMICHDLRITQQHSREGQGEKFKTISVMLWAWAILEQTPEPDDSVDEELKVTWGSWCLLSSRPSSSSIGNGGTDSRQRSPGPEDSRFAGDRLRIREGRQLAHCR